MNQDDAQQGTSAGSAQTGNQTGNNEIAEFFRQAGELRSQPRLRSVTGVCRFDVAGAGTWSVAVNDGEVTVIQGAGNALRADCAVSCSAEDFLRILHGENHMNLITAAMQGLVSVSGDNVFAMALLGNVVAAPATTSHRL